jgi:hypothetical protein
MEKETGSNALGENKELPDFFDWKIYLIMNPDLIISGIISEKDAVNHYLDYGEYEHRQYFENKQINFYVYCGGKCGSETLHKTLLHNKMRSYKLHSFNEFRFTKSGKSPFNIINDSLTHNETVYFLDVYRNPIERKFSAFFHNVVPNKCFNSDEEMKSEFYNDYIKSTYTLLINFKRENKDELEKLVDKFSEKLKIDEFHDTYLQITFNAIEDLNIFCKILDKHKNDFGILHYDKRNINVKDYYNSIDEVLRHYNISDTFVNFDLEKKYGIMKYKNMVFIKLRFCDIDEWGQILSKLFGKDITMKPENLTKFKENVDLYNQFNQTSRISKHFIRNLLKDKDFNTYNTIEEKRKYIKYWMERSC